ncbi:hypothetical protein Glove_217g149 [Diversispora epigaea]|uniref:Protein kinase domain-containing protein n=1 Tax=Diversispora epigaea TaxID=1348612 RepID=A0A397IJY0_9GLOM|nr:hypothetical protein Glove_217g149 [Diversispora epigaea]
MTDSPQNKISTYLENIYYTKNETKNNDEDEFQRYFKLAEEGNHLGHEHGIGTIEDKKKAFQWYLKLAEGGDNNGQCNLGYCYENGIGIIKDEKKAFQWYLKSAEGGNNDGQFNLGYCYRNGIGTTKDEKKAFQCYLKSAEGGNNDGQFILGYCYQHGIGTTKDEKKAFQWYLKSAEGGSDNGQCNLGYCYLNGIGTLPDEKKAFQCYLKLAERGNGKGQNNIGYCYLNGIGTIKDEEKAFQWYLKSAEGGERSNKYVLPIFGITQDSMTKEYAIVLRYMKNGNLREFLNQNKSLSWIERIWLLNSFIRGLKVIHSKGFIHHDLHPGNLMITEASNYSKYKFIRLGDLGLCKLANETSSSGAYGVLPYIASEVFDKYQYTQASDIYSVGMIMWVISTGKRPFATRAYDPELVVDIFNGLRPKINKDTPQCYIELMEKCWHKDPFERPSVEEIYDITEKWIHRLTYDEKAEYSIMFLNAEQRMYDDECDEDLSSHSKA